MLSEWLLQLFWLVVCLFGLGSFFGSPSLLLLSAARVDNTRAKSPAMVTSLALALIGGLVITTAAVAYFADCAPVSVQSCPTLREEVWQGFTNGVGIPALELTIYADGLAVLFLGMIGFLTVCAAVFSFGWLPEDDQRHRVAGGLNLFVLAMVLMVIVDHAFWLLLALELVTLTSAYLMLYRGRGGGSAEDSQKALSTYLITSHLSLILILAAVLIMGVSYGSLDFSFFRAWSEAPREALSWFQKQLVFVLLLLGFGIRAGLTPFHFWVPIAHPQLPTNIHAMISAVMLKLPIYLMIRFFLEFLQPNAWWGIALLIAAGLTSVTSVFYALLSKDLKRALAYHSVENVGIIVVGLGLAIFLTGEKLIDRPAVHPALELVSGLALAASLYHVLNHALFKTLLFLCTAGIENRTGTVAFGRLGGVLVRFPTIGISLVIGALAIAGFPPLNGFISEWLTLQAIIGGITAFDHPDIWPYVGLAVSIFTLLTLSLSIALTALAFIKIVGQTLLGVPRDSEILKAEKKGDVPRPMGGVLAFLALVCLGIGLLPGLLLPGLLAAVNGVGLDTSTIASSSITELTIQLSNDSGMYQANLSILPVGLLLFFTAGAWLAAWLWSRRNTFLSSPVWAGGEAYDPETMQYTGAIFSSLIWKWLSRKKAPPFSDGPLPAFFNPAKEQFVPEPFNLFYNFLIGVLLLWSAKIGDALQNGDIRRYLWYIFFALFLGLIFLVVF